MILSNLKKRKKKSARKYVKYIEKAVKVPIKIVSVGPDRTQTIKL